MSSQSSVKGQKDVVAQKFLFQVEERDWDKIVKEARKKFPGMIGGCSSCVKWRQQNENTSTLGRVEAGTPGGDFDRPALRTVESAALAISPSSLSEREDFWSSGSRSASRENRRNKSGGPNSTYPPRRRSKYPRSSKTRGRDWRCDLVTQSSFLQLGC